MKLPELYERFKISFEGWVEDDSFNSVDMPYPGGYNHKNNINETFEIGGYTIEAHITIYANLKYTPASYNLPEDWEGTLECVVDAVDVYNENELVDVDWDLSNLKQYKNL